MKLTVSQQALARGLSTVARAVSPRSTLPVLANVLLATENGRLRLSATNLEIGISCWIPAQIQEEGAVTVPARTLVDIISKLPADQIMLKLNENTFALGLKCGGFSSSVKGIDANEFPPMPTTDLSQGLQISVAALKDLIRATVYACSSDEARPALQGCLVELTPDTGVSFAATDGFRIAVKTMALAGIEKPYKAIIPARALSELSRIATDAQEAVTVAFPEGRGQVVFRLKDAELISQLIEGNFPPYQQIVPKSHKTRVTVATAAFSRACEQAEIIAREGNNVVKVGIVTGTDAARGRLELSASSEQAGNAEVTLEVDVHGFALELAFNVTFVKQALAATAMPFITLDVNEANTPGVIRGVGDDSWLNVLMPMHLG
jgi:DNA polymerase-3 subunit beta